MIDRQRPSRLASERAKALFLGDVSISKQLEKEERDLRKALRLSRMEAQRVKRQENESKSVKSSPSSLSSSSPSSSSSSPPSLPLSLPPVTNKTTASSKNKRTKTASSSTKSQRRKMGKPKAMEISAELAKDIGSCCCNTINSIHSPTEKRPKFNWIIRTRSQNGSVTNGLNHIEYSKSPCGINGISPSVVPCALHPGAVVAPMSNGLNSLNSANCDKPRPKIMAQRKFASITYNGNTYLKPRDTDFSSMKQLFTKHKPSAEDFLTFLCFRSTNLLPPHLDFYTLNNITSKNNGMDLVNNDITTDNHTANGTAVESINSTIKSQNGDINHQSYESNLSTSSTKPNSKGPANGKVQGVRKRASNNSVNNCRKTGEHGKKEPKTIPSSRTTVKRKGRVKLANNNFTVNHLNNVTSTKNVDDLEKTNSAKKKKVDKIASKTCSKPRKGKSTTYENRPKKSSDVKYSQSKRSRKESSPSSSKTSRHKSQTKVIVSKSKRKAKNDFSDDPISFQPISNGKISKKSRPEVSDINNNTYKSNGSVKVMKRAKSCDRILRSTRKSSSSEAVQDCELICPPIKDRQKLSETPVENLDNKLSNGSAINKSSVNSPKKRRNVDNGDVIPKRYRSKGKETISTTTTSESTTTRPPPTRTKGLLKAYLTEHIPFSKNVARESSGRGVTRSCSKR